MEVQDITELRKWVREKGYRLTTLPNHRKGYKYRISGGINNRDQMYAYNINEVIFLVNCAKQRNKI